MNSLKNYPPNQKLQVMQNNTIYTFRITDFLKIWNDALCYSSSFISMPKFPKNPFTNLPFNIADMVTCYLRLKDTYFDIPHAVSIFWKMSLDIEKFRIEAHPYLTERAVINHIADSTNDILFYDIINMVAVLSEDLNDRIISQDVKIDIADSLVDQTKIYLKKYLLSVYTYNPIKQKCYKQEVIKDLRTFFENNPLAGRKVVYPAWLPRTVANNFFTANSSNSSDSIFIFGENRENEIISTIDDNSTHEEESESYNELLDDSNEDESNEDESNEDESNEDESNEDESNEDEAKEDEAKEDDAKEDDAKEDDAKEDDAKEDDAKEDDAKEDEYV